MNKKTHGCHSYIIHSGVVLSAVTLTNNGPLVFIIVTVVSATIGIFQERNFLVGHGIPGHARLGHCLLPPRSFLLLGAHEHPETKHTRTKMWKRIPCACTGMHESIP